MPTGPKGQRHPADAVGNAVKVMRIFKQDNTKVLLQRFDARADDRLTDSEKIRRMAKVQEASGG